MAQSDAQIVGPHEVEILNSHGIGPKAFLGAGGESRVFAIDEHRILRIFHGQGPIRDDSVDRLLASWRGTDLGFTLPVVLEAGYTDGQSWTVDRRVPGRSLREALERGDREERRRLLGSALEVVSTLRRLPTGHDGFGLVAVPGAPRFTTLVDLLDERMDAGIAFGGGGFTALVPDLAAQRSRMRETLADREAVPHFVHNDICPGNLMARDGGASGVVDFSVHALAADPVMDLVGLVCMLGRYPGSDEDEVWLEGTLLDLLGGDGWLVEVYRRFYGAYYSMDPVCWQWGVSQFARPW